MIKLKIDAKKLGVSDKILNKLGENADKVQIDALNRTITGMRTDGTRLIVKESGLKRPIVFKSFRLYQANKKQDALGASVVISGKTIPLYQFAPKPSSPMTGRTKGGVRIRVGKSKIQFKHAFIGKMPSNHIGMFQRQISKKNKKGREPIIEMFGPSMPQIAHREEIENEVMKKAEERFNKRFDQQADRFLKKQGLK
ncbi:phage tail protein [Serratia sp. MF2]|uniref:phage tail protein n=1 Tax=Serratia sp. MF1(2023) TaxID=3059171 RepID=UPI0027E5ECB1|nr:phage tail protein [Serratia sp. MF1(2023)]MDQ7104205.1 phage tail protein [Serratia sp. MF1(2023)]